MKLPKLTKLELRIMEALWTKGACSVREIHEFLPAKARPAYTTVQTTVYRLEAKKALRCVGRAGNANVFEAVVSREAARGRLLDELLTLFGGGPSLLMAHMIESGKLTREDIAEAEAVLAKLEQKGRSG
jgi:BlaI family transcriptional regulator, penicillinase repressor